MSVRDEFSLYFKSGNDIPVERAVIKTDIAHQVIAELDQLRELCREQHEALQQASMCFALAGAAFPGNKRTSSIEGDINKAIAKYNELIK